MKKELVVIILSILLLTTFISAKITISPPEEIYSLGDEIDLKITTVPTSISGFFEVNLRCKNETLNIERFIANRFKLGDEQTTITKFPLTPAYIGNLKGICSIIASLSDESISTEQFTISDKVLITAILDKPNYDPGEPITLALEAIRANGDLFDGIMEVSNAISFEKSISEGTTTETFSLPETTEAGTYKINIKVYDKTGDNTVLNSGNKTLTFSINQVASWIETSLSELEATPGEEFTISSEIYDQSGKSMDGVVSVTITPPTDEPPTQLAINSGEFKELEFPTNQSPGTYKIFSVFSGLTEEKEFTIKEMQKVDLEFLEESILLVTNIGNTLYNQTIEINIGKEVETLDLNIEVGEQRKFNLRAPDGEYEVQVTDGDIVLTGSLLLTGSAVSVEDFESIGLFFQHPLVWTFLIVLLAGVALTLFFRFRKTKTIREKPGFFKKLFGSRRKMQTIKTEPEEDKDMIDISKQGPNEAESSLVLKGEKQRSSVVTVKINNYHKLGDQARNELAKILSIARQKKAMVDVKENYVLLIFSPLITKTFENEKLAAKLGFKIFNELQTYNKKFKDKIQFSIGANSGDLIASKKEGKLQYTGMGNTISLAKRIADSTQDKFLISENIRKKLVRDLKVQKTGMVGKTAVYMVTRVTDREANQAKLQDLLKRMERD